MIDGTSSELVKFLFNQGTGVAFGITCLVILYYSHKETIKDKNETVERLKGIIYERKTDRDALLQLMGKIEAHLTMSNAIRQIAQQAVSETLMHTERRRKLDTFIENTLAADEIK